MTVKESVLLQLEENKNKALSGEELAKSLGCTRASVWKAIKALEKEGYQIEAVSNKGYTLKTSADVLSKTVMEQLLQKENIDIQIKVFDTIDSTNEEVKRMAAAGEAKDVVVVSAKQTAGKGRRGRSFYSPENTGVYLSFLLHPDVAMQFAASLTTLAVTAEAIAIEKVCGLDTRIKWVNDILINNKKVSGILTEGSSSFEDNKLSYVVVGIGINIYEPKEGFPEEIKDIAGALYANGEIKENLKNQLVAQLITEFMNFYRDFPENTYLQEYEKRCFVIGQKVNIISSDHNTVIEEGVEVLGINEDCHLLIRHNDGHEEYMSSGEISVRV